MFNIAAIIGIVALITPLAVSDQSRRKDFPMCLIAALMVGISGNQLYLDGIQYHEATPADVALAWLLANPVVTAPIIGPRTVEQLAGSLRALEIELSAEELAKLDEIWPGPGAPAPEAYAW